MRNVGSARPVSSAPPVESARPAARPVRSARLAHRVREAGRLAVLAGSLVGLGGLGACNSLTKSDQLPPEVTDPAITQTPAGALAAYYGTLAQFQQVLDNATDNSYVVATGVLTDELAARSLASSAAPLDIRKLDDSPTAPTLNGEPFQSLSGVRQRARQARGLLHDYRPADTALQAHMYTVEGYAEVLLAELYCSGIPLSTVDYQGDYTLQPGSSTAAVFTHARALFDTALALAGDSVGVLQLSRVGQARAWLGLDDYAAAAAAVAAVPDGFQYALHYHQGTTLATTGMGYQSSANTELWHSDLLTVADQEGGTGLAYRTSQDPRTPVTAFSDFGVGTWYHPDKYPTTGADTLVLASGVEARLIAAEAALQAGDASWLATLNALRTDGTFETPDPTGAPGNTDTLWHAGTGGVARLAPLTDPGSDTARVSLLFRERGFWLFLTGHRQGDLRRLVRQYHRPEATVYPTGTSLSGLKYGSNVDLPVPWAERTLNPLFTGCIARD